MRNEILQLKDLGRMPNESINDTESIDEYAEPLKNKGFTWASLCARAHRVTHPAHSDAFLHPQSNTTRSISASYISTFATSLWITDELYTYPQI